MTLYDKKEKYEIEEILFEEEKTSFFQLKLNTLKK